VRRSHVGADRLQPSWAVSAACVGCARHAGAARKIDDVRDCLTCFSDPAAAGGCDNPPGFAQGASLSPHGDNLSFCRELRNLVWLQAGGLGA